MVTVKVRVQKNVVFNEPIRKIQLCNIVSSDVEAHLLLWTTSSLAPCAIESNNNLGQRISFYDSGKLIKEIKVRRYIGRDKLYSLFDDVFLPVFNHAMEIDDVDKLK